MRNLCVLFQTLIIFTSIFMATTARADKGSVTTLNFAVTRNGELIGNTTVRLHRNGDQTIAEVATQVQVKIAFVTVYRYEQRQTERWIAGRLAALNSVTNDNGNVYKVSARRTGDRLSVNADGKVREVDPGVIPANLWNASLVRTAMALNPTDGSVMPISVVDRGTEQLLLQGRPTTAHRYSIKTTIPQEVWYDEQHRLLKVQLRASDGSTINTTLSAT